MTIGSWILFIVGVMFIGFSALMFMFEVNETANGRVLTGIVAGLLMAGLFFGLRWYHANTASGQRALTDQKSELANGLERTITVYTADGNVIAQYEGIIDIEGNDGGYVLFDFEGKRYTYYNCFVESIAEIG